MLERLERPTLEKALPCDPVTRSTLAELERRWLVLHRDGRWVRLVVVPEESRLGPRLVKKVITAVRRAM
jgi:hypothetical protein